MTCPSISPRSRARLRRVSNPPPPRLLRTNKRNRRTFRSRNRAGCDRDGYIFQSRRSFDTGVGDKMSSMATPSTSMLIRRAVTRRCPVCGRGAIFERHFRMNRSCPRCHVIFWKDPGESLGAMYVDYAVATVAFLIAWLILDFTTHLSDPVQVAIVGAIAVGSILIFY